MDRKLSEAEILRISVRNFLDNLEILDEILLNSLMEIGGGGLCSDRQMGVSVGLMMVEMYQIKLKQCVSQLEDDLKR